MFVLLGGIGVPLAFVVLWLVLDSTLRGSRSILEAMVWIDSIRAMVWPSSMLAPARAPGDVSGESMGLVVALVLNVILYGLIGWLAALALPSRLRQLAFIAVLIAGAWSINEFWSEHEASLWLFIVLVVIVFGTLFFRLGARANNSQRF